MMTWTHRYVRYKRTKKPDTLQSYNKLIIAIMMAAEALSKPKATTETTTEVISTTMEHYYTAIVKNADGSEVRR